MATVPTWKPKQRPTDRPPRPRDAASLGVRQVLLGGGAFDVSGEHPNQKGWDIFELGQRSFWAVPTAIDWEAPVEERPEAIGPVVDMLAFLAPGEKAAVTGATLISAQVKSEEAQFYFAEQALEEAKHYDAMRRMVRRLSGRPLPPPGLFLRLLYSFGVIDRDDVAFMMGSINVIGEHLAHQILHTIRQVGRDPQLVRMLQLIARDESRHVAAGRRFFPEVYDELRRNRRRILAKNLATVIVLAAATTHLVNPLREVDLDVADLMEGMFRHYHDVTHGLPAFPEQGLLDALVELTRRMTPAAVATISAATTDQGRLAPGKLVAACERALRSPRALRRLFAA